MGASQKDLKRWTRFVPELLLGLLLTGLFLIIVLPAPGAGASTSPDYVPHSPAASLPLQGTPLVTTVSDAIDGTDPTFTGQRHFRSGISGDRNCLMFSVNGPRFYDQVVFLNSSPVTQRVIVGFTSFCASNTYMFAVGPQFNPTDICDGYIAGAGVSGSTNWEFTVCPNSQFSIVTYGLEPGVTCEKYLYSVFGSGIVLLGPATAATGSASPPATVDPGPFAISDVKTQKTKRKIPGTDTRKRRLEPPGVSSPPNLLPALGSPPLVAMVGDSIGGNEPTFINQSHFRSGIPGDGNCGRVIPVDSRGTPFERHFYDEFIFFNNSLTSQRISVNFSPACGFVAFMAAYSPQINPNDICANFIASSGVSAPVIWEFTVCPSSQFSIVVYNSPADTECPDYSFKVFANGVTFLGTTTDLAITKTAPPGAITPNSNVTYTIRVTNNGPNPAKDLRIDDVLPAGTKFFSLSSGGASCVTPPVGSPGTVSCSLGLLAAPGTNLPNSLTMLLTVMTTPQAPSTIVNTATVSRFGIETTPANNSATVSVSFSDFCLQEDSGSNVLGINVATGDYVFSSCQGITLTGRGTISVRGCILTLQHSSGDRRLTARVDTCAKSGTASVQHLPTGKTFQIIDRNTANNTCACATN